MAKNRRSYNRSRETRRDESDTYTGIFRLKKGAAVIIPDGKKEVDIFVPRLMNGGARNGDRVEFKLLPRKHSKGSLEAQIIRIFDADETFLAEKLLFEEKHEIRGEFPKKLDYRDADFPAADRTDVFCVTIDPNDAKDFDDAVSVEKSGKGYKLGVYIADVSRYVAEGSALDSEALKRGCSVYLPWGVTPMLPHELSEDLCSLRPDKERFAISCVMDVSAKGVVKNPKFERCRIISKQRLTYSRAQKIIDSTEKTTPELTKALGLMNELGHILHNKRIEEGSLDFELPEVRARMGENGLPVALVLSEKHFTNQIVEEFMLCANRAAAEKLSKKYDAAIYRIHGQPEEEALHALYTLLKTNNIEVPAFEGLKSYRTILEKVKGTPFEKSVHTMVLRSMPKARYSPENKGHFGLAFDYYTHFTSPIRRYPDLMVHRMLMETKQPKRDLGFVAEQSSFCEDRSMKAERDSTNLCAVRLVQDKIGQEVNGRVTGIIEAGLFLELEGLYVDGMVHVSKLGGDYFYFDPTQMAMVGRTTKRQIKLGDTFRVRIIEACVALRRIDLQPV